MLTSFLRETSLWDLNTGTGQAAEVPLSDYTTTLSTNDHIGAGAGGGGNNHPSKTNPTGGKQGQGQGLSSNLSVSSPLPPPAPKGPQNKDAANRLHSLRSVHLAVAPEIALMAAR